MLPSHDSASYELLSLTALCGEFPCDSAARFIDSESYRKKIVTGLTHNRLLRIFSRNHLRGYRLGIRGKRLLQDQEPERFLFICPAVGIQTLLNRSRLAACGCTVSHGHTSR